MALPALLGLGRGAVANPGAVVLHDQGKSVQLSNEFVTIAIRKSDARATSLEADGINALDHGGRIYWQQYGQTHGVKTTFSTPSNCTYAVTTDTVNCVDVSFMPENLSSFPFKVEYHYVLRRGDHGFYNYFIVTHDPNKVGDSDYEQHNVVERVNPSIYQVAAVDVNRIGTMPTPQELDTAPSLADATYQLPDGSVYTKYQWSVMEGDHHVHGVMGHGHGIWIIQPSLEYLNGGPTHQELTVHQTNTTPVLLSHGQAAHYGAGTTEIKDSDGLWQKFCGPWFTYLNTGDTNDAMWADANERAVEEVAKWPYTWVDNPLYPLQRTEVAGRLQITDGTNAAGAWVILSEPSGPGQPDWQREGKHYHFWAKTDALGNFTIKNVRAGTYALYVIAKGAFGQYEQDGIVVSGSQLDLGEIDWTPDHLGQTLWQIGIPDRSAAEFLHGDDFRTWGNWEMFGTDFPNSVNYYVGRDDWHTDWNYVQPNVQTGNGLVSPPWTIHFTYHTPAPQQARLTIGKAAGTSPSLRVTFNGHTILPRTSLTHDSAVARLGIQGYYEQEDIDVPSADFVDGDNVITLYQDHIGTFSGIMYDAIRMEVVPTERRSRRAVLNLALSR